jgi:bifunctional DNase/RNase
MTLVPMTIKGLMLDPISNSPIVVLKNESDSVFLPIWVGIFEANAIALRLEDVETPRPMTHDLLTNIISDVEGHVTQVVINDLVESTFYARIFMTLGTRELEIDARPSDALALALRTDAPIFVDQSVLDQAQTLTAEEGQDDKLRKWFEQLKPEDLGKYKM